MTAPKPNPGRHRALGPGPDSSAAVRVQRQHVAPRRVNRPGTLRHRLRAVAHGLLFAAANMALTALFFLIHDADAEGAWFFVKSFLLFSGPAMLLYAFTRPRDLPPDASTLTTEELIAAENAAIARAARQQEELQAGQRHLAELEALNASTEQRLVLDDPQPDAQLGAAPFRDNFQTVAERVMRPTPAEPSPTSGISTATATEDVTAPKLLK